jgi:hypothetical protein
LFPNSKNASENKIVMTSYIPDGDESSVSTTESSYSPSKDLNSPTSREPSDRDVYDESSNSSESSYLEDLEADDDDDDEEDVSISSSSSNDETDNDDYTLSNLGESKRSNCKGSGWDASMRSNGSTIASVISQYSADGKSHISTLLSERQSQHSHGSSLSPCGNSSRRPSEELAQERRQMMFANMKNAASSNSNPNRAGMQYFQSAAPAANNEPGMFSIDLHQPVPGLSKRRHSSDGVSRNDSRLMNEFSNNTTEQQAMDQNTGANGQRRKSIGFVPVRDGGTSFYSNMAASSHTSSSLNIDLFRSIGLNDFGSDPSARRSAPLRSHSMDTKPLPPGGDIISIDAPPIHPRSAGGSPSLHVRSSIPRRPSLDSMPVQPRSHRASRSFDGAQSFLDSIRGRRPGVDSLPNHPPRARHTRSLSFDCLPTHPRSKKTQSESPSEKLMTALISKGVVDDFTVGSSGNSSSDGDGVQGTNNGASEEVGSAYSSADGSPHLDARASKSSATLSSGSKLQLHERDSEPAEALNNGVYKNQPPPILTLTIELKSEMEVLAPFPMSKTTAEEETTWPLQASLPRRPRRAARRRSGGARSTSTNSGSSSVGSVESFSNRKWHACLEQSLRQERKASEGLV